MVVPGMDFSDEMVRRHPGAVVRWCMFLIFEIYLRIGKIIIKEIVRSYKQSIQKNSVDHHYVSTETAIATTTNNTTFVNPTSPGRPGSTTTVNSNSNNSHHTWSNLNE
jgi:hypothetical protein